ncbi:dienelactone hydrolase family protein [Marisediminicola senii]|uniref:dienelactone hydrolase family protein n=1 Tax=Marisediminicola senii TaxID=2711233 RepID=UPI0013EAF8D3|nr:dienelactone hydrolase family protein [Marisediminicola senii]
MTTTIALRGDTGPAGTGTEFDAYVAVPAGEVRGAVIVIHEIWGLVDHITGIADRLAAEGYLAIAPDLLSRVGIDPPIGLELQDIMFSQDPKVRSDGQPRLREALSPLRSPEFGADALASLTATVDYLVEQPGVDGRIAVTGFCFGGSNAFALAAADHRIRAAVPFYGQGPEASADAGIACPVLAFYGQKDTGLIDALPTVTATLEGAGVDFRTEVYPQTGHAFFNDTNPFTYDADAANDAWTKLLAFLDETLGAQAPADAR